MRPLLARKEDKDPSVLKDKVRNASWLSSWSGTNGFLLNKTYFSFLDENEGQNDMTSLSFHQHDLQFKESPATKVHGLENTPSSPEFDKLPSPTSYINPVQEREAFGSIKSVRVECPEEPIPEMQNESLLDISRKLYELSICPQFSAQVTKPKNKSIQVNKQQSPKSEKFDHFDFSMHDQARPSVSPPIGERTQFWMNGNKATFTPPPSPTEPWNNSFFEQLEQKAMLSPLSSPDSHYGQSPFDNKLRRFSESDLPTSPNVSSAVTPVMNPVHHGHAVFDSSMELESYHTDIFTNQTSYIAAYPRYSIGSSANPNGSSGMQSTWQENGVNVSMPLNLQLHLRNKIVECAFCRKNGETREFYTTHKLKDHRGMVVCPILRKYVCPQCGATEDNAHTIRHCPLGVLSDL